MREERRNHEHAERDGRRAANVARWQVPEHEIAFLCECDRPGCSETVPLTASAYRLIVEAGGRAVSGACLERERR